MLREQDWSQFLLIIGLPAYFLFGGLVMIWLGRRLMAAPPGAWGFFTKSGIMGSLLLSLLVFLYLGYWLWQVWRTGKND